VPKRRYQTTKLRCSNILEDRGSQVCKSSIKIREVVAAVRERKPPVPGALSGSVIDCNEWKTEKRHECANMGKEKQLEL